jgi:hypothetical protein
MVGNSKLRFGYRAMQVAIVIGCLSLAFNLVGEHKQAASTQELSSRTEAQMEQTGKLLADARKLGDQTEEQVAQAQQTLGDAEGRASADAANPEPRRAQPFAAERLVDRHESEFDFRTARRATDRAREASHAICQKIVALG